MSTGYDDALGRAGRTGLAMAACPAEVPSPGRALWLSHIPHAASVAQAVVPIRVALAEPVIRYKLPAVMAPRSSTINGSGGCPHLLLAGVLIGYSFLNGTPAVRMRLRDFRHPPPCNRPVRSPGP